MMNKIAHVVVGLPVDGHFDYAVPSDLQAKLKVGMRVEVTFSHQKKTGYVVGLAQESSFARLSSIQNILDDDPALSENLLKITKAFSQYYGCSWGEAIEAALPDYLRQTKIVNVEEIKVGSHERLDQTESQLIYGTDRTAIRKSAEEKIEKILSQKKSVIVLFSEKNYLKYFKEHGLKKTEVPVFIFDDLTSKQEFELWKQVRSSDFCLVLGLRKTIFAPVNHLGLIIIFDEDHIAYKQDQTPFYHVDRVALIRQKIERCSVLLTAVVPRIETRHQAAEEQWKVIECRLSAVPRIQLVDLTNYKLSPGRISIPLQNKIDESIKTGKKILILMNRKGYSSFTSCQQCGFVMKCSRCDVPLVYSFTQKKLICRRCNSQLNLPPACPQCQKSYLKSWGTGIEKLKNDLSKFYPQQKIAAFDNETKEFPKDSQIIIATQAILSFQDSIRFDLTAVLDFDQEISRADYKSHHKVFSLLMNLETITRETLLVQTMVPENFILKRLKESNCEGFYQDDLQFRRELELPPYQHLTALCVRGPVEKKVFEESERLLKMLESEKNDNVVCSDVYTDVYPKWRDKFRYTILLKSDSTDATLNVVRPVLQKFKRKKDVIVTVNVDP